jgi:hypothetical protein
MLQVPVPKLQAAGVEGGYANLEIVSSAGDLWFLPYKTSTLPARPSAPVTVNLDAPRRKLLCGKNANGQAYAVSSWVKLRQREPAPAVVGQGYIVHGKGMAGDYMTFEYNKTTTMNQTSTLGIGVSGLGFDAGYSHSGTNITTATGTEDYRHTTENSWFRTNFNVGQFRAECYGYLGEHNVHHQKQKGQCPRTFTNQHGVKLPVHKCLWQVKSTGWDAGATIVNPKTIPFAAGKYCTPQGRGSTFSTSNETAVQWSSGYDIGATTGIKGINLKASYSDSAQTGYDTNAVMQFHFQNKGVACGVGKDASNAGIVVMRHRR